MIYFKLKTLGKKVRNIIMDFDSIKEWDKKKQSQLLELQKKMDLMLLKTHLKYLVGIMI